MTKLGVIVGILGTTLCLAAEAQTISVRVLDQAGAQTVLQAARESAQQRNAPSAIAVVDRAGDLLAFQRMDGVRLASLDLAVEKARTAARLQRPTVEIEDSIDQGRTAFVTANIMALRGGMPVRVNGEVVGAVGIAGLSKETDTRDREHGGDCPDPVGSRGLMPPVIGARPGQPRQVGQSHLPANRRCSVQVPVQPARDDVSSAHMENR
jgi:glc operon protein GlcG